MSWLKKSPSQKASSGHDVAALKGEIVDKISAAIMMIDRDFIVTYVNGPTRKLLKKNAGAFRAIWPTSTRKRSSDVHRHVPQEPGASAPATGRTDTAPNPDRNHHRSSKGRTLLVNGSFDAKGNLVGNTLEWQDVTPSRLNKGMLDAINRVQAVIEFDTTARFSTPTKTSSTRSAIRSMKSGAAPFDVCRSGLSAAPRNTVCSGTSLPRRIRCRSVQADRQGRQGGLDPSELQSDPRCQGQSLQGGEICH